MDMEYCKKFEPVDGKWFFTRELGSGAYGSVFEVERKDEYGSMKSAMKIISIPASESELASFRLENYNMTDEEVENYYRSFVDEFYKECQLMSKLKGYTNIVSYEDHDVKPKKDSIGWDIFIRMELLTPLNLYFSKKRYTRDEVVKLGIDICRALEICHEKHILHRDIKAGNIFVSDTGDFKLGDFGVAGILEGVSEALSKKGTYIYMAPEVIKGEKYGYTVDIYSLGIVLYKMMNENMEPFRTERSYTNGEEALKKRLMGESFPKPKNADDRFAKVIYKACAYDAKDRYQSATEFRNALENLLLDVSAGENTLAASNKFLLKNKEPSLYLKAPRVDSLLKKANIIPQTSLEPSNDTNKAEGTHKVNNLKLRPEANHKLIEKAAPVRRGIKLVPEPVSARSGSATGGPVSQGLSKPKSLDPLVSGRGPSSAPSARPHIPSVPPGPYSRPHMPSTPPGPSPRPHVSSVPPEPKDIPVTPGDVRETFEPTSRGARPDKNESSGKAKLVWGIVGGALFTIAFVVGLILFVI